MTKYVLTLWFFAQPPIYVAKFTHIEDCEAMARFYLLEANRHDHLLTTRCQPVENALNDD